MESAYNIGWNDPVTGEIEGGVCHRHPGWLRHINFDVVPCPLNFRFGSITLKLSLWVGVCIGVVALVAYNVVRSYKTARDVRRAANIRVMGRRAQYLQGGFVVPKHSNLPSCQMADVEREVTVRKQTATVREEVDEQGGVVMTHTDFGTTEVTETQSVTVHHWDKLVGLGTGESFSSSLSRAHQLVEVPALLKWNILRHGVGLLYRPWREAIHRVSRREFYPCVLGDFAVAFKTVESTASKGDIEELRSYSSVSDILLGSIQAGGIEMSCVPLSAPYHFRSLRPMESTVVDLRSGALTHSARNVVANPTLMFARVHLRYVMADGGSVDFAQYEVLVCLEALQDVLAYTAGVDEVALRGRVKTYFTQKYKALNVPESLDLMVRAGTTKMAEDMAKMLHKYNEAVSPLNFC